jgi:hypothetical protein
MTSERILEFEVDKQRLTKKRSCDFSHIVSGTVGYLKAKFYFSQSEWEGCKKAASFWIDDKEHAVLLDNDDTCDIPETALMSDRFSVSVTGLRDGYKITTTKTKVKQEVRYYGNC